MEPHRCGICFETFDADVESEHAYFSYVATAGHDQTYPDDVYFCSECLPALRDLTDNWTSPMAVESACAFCGEEDHDGTRISVEFVSQDETQTDASLPVYDLCENCDEVFENFLADERDEVLRVPDGWRVFGPSSRHVMGIGTDKHRVYVDPAVKRTGTGFESMSAGVPEDDANCYTVSIVKRIGTAGEGASEIAAFEHADDAIEFAQLVALYASRAPSSVEFVHSDFMPDPMIDDPWRPDAVISDNAPREVIEKMLGYQSHHLEKALDGDGDDE